MDLQHQPDGDDDDDDDEDEDDDPLSKEIAVQIFVDHECLGWGHQEIGLGSLFDFN